MKKVSCDYVARIAIFKNNKIIDLFYEVLESGDNINFTTWDNDAIRIAKNCNDTEWDFLEVTYTDMNYTTDSCEEFIYKVYRKDYTTMLVSKKYL